MKRALFILARGTSLLVLVLSATIWVCTYLASDVIDCEEPGESPFVVHAVWTARGRICVVEDVRGTRGEEEYLADHYVAPVERRWNWQVLPPETYLPIQNNDDEQVTLGGALVFRRDIGDAHGQQWVFAVWPIVLISALPTVAWLARAAKRHVLRRSGACSTCGYDLRATPERCPECGAVPAAREGVHPVVTSDVER